jgi:hypothetical protein
MKKKQAHRGAKLRPGLKQSGQEKTTNEVRVIRGKIRGSNGGCVPENRRGNVSAAKPSLKSIPLTGNFCF